MSGIPRLVIAAPASGCGKTTVATGLMAALARQGLAVSPHKVGPDYIDPGYHAVAAGRPGRNLDSYLSGADLIAPLFLAAAGGCDIAVVEGAMGLYDGAVGHGELASTAHVAKLLAAPVVLVVDAARQGRSVAALVHGFASYDPAVRLAGVILNRVGSDRHEQVLREALQPLGLPVFGVVRRSDAVATPSRHLGLIPAAERAAEAAATVRRLGALVADACDLEALLALARTAPPLAARPWDPDAALAAAGRRSPLPGTAPGTTGRVGPPRNRTGRRPVVALAAGAAFTFTYRENVELLSAAGADVVPFDPLRDERLPAGTRGLVVGGGFPEVFAADLAANEPLRREIAALAAAGAPVAAECAGLLYLSRTLDGRPMCGVVDTDARMTARLTLGYREATAVADSPLLAAGTVVRGHEFHRTAVDPGHGTPPAWRLPHGGAEGFAGGNVIASYLHLHWAATPEAARRFVEHCA